MRLSKQIFGIAVAVAFAFGPATTAPALAVPSGTQVEFKVKTIADDAFEVRSYVIAVVAEEIGFFGL